MNKLYCILKSWSPALFGLAVILAVLSNALPYVHITQDITVIGLGIILIALNVIKNISLPMTLLTICHNFVCRIKIGLRKLAFKITESNNRWYANHYEEVDHEQM